MEGHPKMLFKIMNNFFEYCCAKKQNYEGELFRNLLDAVVHYNSFIGLRGETFIYLNDDEMNHFIDNFWKDAHHCYQLGCFE